MEACLSAPFVARSLRKRGHQLRIIPAKYTRPFAKGQKNDDNDDKAIPGLTQALTSRYPGGRL
jgi:transposase